MNQLLDVAKVATGVGIVVAVSIRDLNVANLGSFAYKVSKGVSCNLLRVADLNRIVQPHAASSEARHREEESRERGPSGSMDAFAVFQRVHDDLKNTERSSSTVQDVTPQPETLFAPKEAEESRESKPFESIDADVGVDPLSQKIELPSVRAPPLKSSSH